MEINLAAQKFTISYEHLDYDFKILLNVWLTILEYEATEEERGIFVQFEGECQKMNCTTLQQIEDEPRKDILTGSDLLWLGRLCDLPNEIEAPETKRKPKLESILAATLLRRILINCRESLKSISMPDDAEMATSILFAEMKISTRKGCIPDSREALAHSVVVCRALKQLDLFVVSTKKIMIMYLLGLLEPQCKKYDGTAGKPSNPTKRRETLLKDILNYEKKKRPIKRQRIDNTNVVAEQVAVEVNVAMGGRKKRSHGGGRRTPSETNKKKSRKNVTVATTPPSVEEARPCSVLVGKEEATKNSKKEASQQEEEEAESSSFWNAEGVGMTTSEVDELYCKLRKLNGYYDEI